MDRRAFLKGSLLAIPAVGVATLAARAFDDVSDVDLIRAYEGMSLLDTNGEVAFLV